MVRAVVRHAHHECRVVASWPRHHAGSVSLVHTAVESHRIAGADTDTKPGTRTPVAGQGPGAHPVGQTRVRLHSGLRAGVVTFITDHPVHPGGHSDDDIAPSEITAPSRTTPDAKTVPDTKSASTSKSTTNSKTTSASKAAPSRKATPSAQSTTSSKTASSKAAPSSKATPSSKAATTSEAAANAGAWKRERGNAVEAVEECVNG